MSFVLIIFPLAFLLSVSLQENDIERQQYETKMIIESTISESIPMMDAELTQTFVDYDGVGYDVRIVVYNFSDFNNSNITQLEEKLNNLLSKPVHLDAIILNGKKVESGN